MSFIEANGLKFAYLEWGRPKDPLVLMFHGFPDTPRTWDFAGPRVAELGFRVVAPFMRGYAPTSIPTRDTTSKDLAEDVVGLIRALDAATATIIGHDWGAEAVSAAVGFAPQIIDSVVMVAVPHRTQIPKRLGVAWSARHFVTLRLPGALDRFRANDFAQVDELCRRWSPTWNFSAAELQPVKEAFRQDGSADAALGYYRGVSAFTPPFMKARIAVPTLAVCGLDDPAVAPEDFERARRQFSGRYEVAKIRGGHFCHLESPEPFVEAVTKFLKEQRAT